jgi:hypothetical protein
VHLWLNAVGLSMPLSKQNTSFLRSTSNLPVFHSMGWLHVQTKQVLHQHRLLENLWQVRLKVLAGARRSKLLI